MTRLLAAFALYLTAALAQPAVNAPPAGCVRGVDGALRPVHGITGALLAGAPATWSVIAAACSDSLALVKTDGSLEVRDGGLALLARWDAPAGAALFALPRGAQTGFVYYPATGQLLQVGAQQAPRAVLDTQSLGGAVLAMASPDALHLMALVADTPGPRLVRISTADGTIESQTPLEDVAAPLALLSDGTIVFADGAGLIIRPPGAAVSGMALPKIRPLPPRRGVVTERRMALPATAISIDQMGGVWLAVRLADGSAPLALRLEGASQRTCRIPTMETAQ
jgi:hypothetical protein